MTKLITYTVTFRTDGAAAVEEITAASPQAALAEARAIANDPERADELYFEPYTEHLPVNEIEVDAPDGEEGAVWLDDQLRLRLAAGDLLTALGKAVTALDTAPCFKVPKLDCDSYAVASECEHAIRRAKEEEQEPARPS